MSDLSPAIRSGFIDSNKMHGHVLLAHVRQHQADLDFKISAVETYAAQERVGACLVLHDFGTGEPELRAQEPQPGRCFLDEGLHSDIHKSSLSRTAAARPLQATSIASSVYVRVCRVGDLADTRCAQSCPSWGVLREEGAVLRRVVRKGGNRV